MRDQADMALINKAKLDSLTSLDEVKYTNSKNEHFVFKTGELIAYTDKRVINHEDDRLVDLSEEPYVD